MAIFFKFVSNFESLCGHYPKVLEHFAQINMQLSVISLCTHCLRFSKDVDVIDVTLPMTSRAFISQLFTVLSTGVVVVYSTPDIVVALIPVLIVYYFIQVSWTKCMLPPLKHSDRLQGEQTDMLAETVTSTTNQHF